MKQTNTLLVPNTTACITDGAMIHLLHHQQTVNLSVIDPISFRVVDDFILDTRLMKRAQPCIDNDCVYIPTAHGQILGADKFSGEVLVTMDMGSMIVISELLQDKHNIYSVCGVPLTNGVKTETNTYTICVNDKLTGKKRFQSKSEPDNIRLTIGDTICGICKNKLSVYGKNCEPESSLGLSYAASFPPLMTENFIVSCTTTGTLEIFQRKSRESHGKLLIEPSNIAPIALPGNILYWITVNGIYSIGLQNNDVEFLGEGAKATSLPIFDNGHLYFTSQSNATKFNIETRKSENLTFSSGKHYKAMLFDRFLVLGSSDGLCQIEV